MLSSCLLFKGGPVIVPFDSVLSCATPLGSDFFYLNFQINLPG